MKSNIFYVLPALASTVLAQTFYATCDVSQAVLDLPQNQTALAIPSGVPPNSIALGVGFQNYTCTNSGTYTSAGAVARFYDISCLYDVPGPAFAIVQDIAFDLWNETGFTLADLDVFSKMLVRGWSKPMFLGSHFFQPTTSGIGPVFDYRAGSRRGDQQAFVAASANGSIPAPTGPGDVAWLSLNGVSGDLATHVFRVDTVSGTPPPSCTPNSGMISVKYTAKYWLFGGQQAPGAVTPSSTNSGATATVTVTVTATGSSATGAAKGEKLEAVEDTQISASVGLFDPSSKYHTLIIVLVAINGAFLVGIIAVGIAWFVNNRNSSGGRYGQIGKPQINLDAADHEHENMGPYDPHSSNKRVY